MGVNIGPALRELLKEKGWSQRRLADETGMKRADVNKIVNGFSVGQQRHARLLEPFGLTPADVPGIPDGEEPAPSLSDRLQSLEAAVEREGKAVTKSLEALAKEVRALNSRREHTDHQARRTAR